MSVRQSPVVSCSRSQQRPLTPPCALWMLACPDATAAAVAARHLRQALVSLLLPSRVEAVQVPCLSAATGPLDPLILGARSVVVGMCHSLPPFLPPTLCTLPRPTQPLRMHPSPRQRVYSPLPLRGVSVRDAEGAHYLYDPSVRGMCPAGGCPDGPCVPLVPWSQAPLWPVCGSLCPAPQVTHTYGEGDLTNFKMGYVYVTVVNNLSQIVCVIGQWDCAQSLSWDGGGGGKVGDAGIWPLLAALMICRHGCNAWRRLAPIPSVPVPPRSGPCTA
jgi:hypothetical protein